MTDSLDEIEPSKPSVEQYGDPDDPSTAPLLTLPDREAAKHLYQRWKNYPKDKLQRERAEYQVNQWRLDGRTNCFVQKTQDQNRWQAWSPPFTQPPVPVLNKAKRLCGRLTAMTFADPPVAESAREEGEEGDQEATEFSLRVLNDLQSEGQLDDLRTARRAFYLACVAKRGYVRYYADPKGGGKKPIRIMAKPGAQNANEPFTLQGQPLPGELIGRYVMQDGTLTDKPAEAATRWMPALKKEILHPLNVRLFPHDSDDIWEATEIVIGTMPTWGELLDLWPDELGKLNEDDKNAIFSFKPENQKDLLGLQDKLPKDDKRDEREKRVPVFMAYCKAGSYYPDGCYAVCVADRVMLHRQPWVGEVDGKREELDIPVTEYTQFEGGDGLMDKLGGGNEIRAAQIGHLLAYMDQFTNRKRYIPINSILQSKSNQLMMGTDIAINPGGEPKFEEIPDFPQAPLETFTLMTDEMNDESGMQETAQGTQSPDVNSGIQASVIVQQAQAGLTDVRQNTERAWIRAQRIVLQLARITYSVPQQIDWEGEDGKYRQKWWTGADLKSAVDIKLKRGSLSMMNPGQKMMLGMQLAQLGPLSPFATQPELFQELIANSLGPSVGIRDDEQRMRIKRQIAQWTDGPPENWQPPQAPMMPDPMTGQPVPAMQPDPMTGQPVPVPPPVDPYLASIWEPLPTDELQDIATVRLGELKRFMASTRYTRWPPEWRLGVDQEFEHMKQAAGVMTVMEQQQMQQQQMQQQAQMQQDQQAQQQQQQEADGHAKSQEQEKASQAEEAKHRAEQESKAQERQDKMAMQERQFAHEKEVAAMSAKPKNFQIQRDPSGRMVGVQGA